MDLRARFYDPSIGRFMQADPARTSGWTSQGWDRYAYVGNTPTTWADPSGLLTFVITGIIGAPDPRAASLLEALPDAKIQMSIPNGIGIR